MLTRLENIFLYRYENLLERDRARVTLWFTLLTFSFYVVYTFAIRFDNYGGYLNVTVFEAALLDPLIMASMVAFYVAFLGGLSALRGGRLFFAMLSVLIMVYAGVVLLGWFTSNMSAAVNGVVLAGFVLMAALLLGRNAMWIAAVISIFSYLGSQLTREGRSPRVALETAVELAFVLVAVALITQLFLRIARLNRMEGAIIANEERIKLAELTTRLGQRVSRRTPLNEVLSSLVEEIRRAYPILYHVQIFLIDENGQEARLVASTGEIGQLLLARKHGLAVGSLSVIGQAMVRRDPVIERANTPGTVHRRNELLPDTAVEAAFPLRIGDTHIGALDLQSTQADAFDSPDDVATYVSLAESVAVAIDNARLFEQTEQRLGENQRLLEQMRGTMREIELMNERLTGRAWADYLKTRGEQLNLVIDFDDAGQPHLHETEPVSATLAEAIRAGDVVDETLPDRRVVAVPLRVRGQVVGAMEFELDKREFSQDDLNLLQEVGSRFGLAAENTRLLEESQRLAQREALVNEIGNRLQGTNNVETTLSEAARSLGESLKAAKVSIRLGTPQQ